MVDTTKIGLTLIAAEQSQKHVTMNEALLRLDQLVQQTVINATTTVPPVSPATGDAYIIPAGATGEWAGKSTQVASYINGLWVYYTPVRGWRAYDLAASADLIFDGSTWSNTIGMSVSELGINATADATNRLVVASEASLLTHDGAGHQLKINKALNTDTASLLFQTGFSGRAEMGTVGSDNFDIKVSVDGSTWNTAISLTGASGVAEFPTGASVGGQDVFHRGNILGTVGESAGSPTGAVIEQGGTGNSRYVRFADGTQIVWVTDVNMGSILAAGSGTWSLPYRTDPVSLTWPVAFVASPAASVSMAPIAVTVPLGTRGLVPSNLEPPSAIGWNFIRAMRIGDSTFDFDVGLTVMAVGRWF